jgi:hypothetical protein
MKNLELRRHRSRMRKKERMRIGIFAARTSASDCCKKNENEKSQGRKTRSHAFAMRMPASFDRKSGRKRAYL